MEIWKKNNICAKMTKIVEPTAPLMPEAEQIVPPIMSQRKADNLLYDACKTGNLRDARVAILSGANVNHTIGDTPCLFWAVIKENEDIINLLIEHDVDTDVRVGGYNALFSAIERGNVNIVKTLIRHGASANSETEITGETPLTYASCSDKAEIVETLITYGGAHVNHATRRFGCTPLHLAANRGRLEVVKVLLKYGGNWRLKNKAGQNVLDATPNGPIRCLFK